jgi:8-oxo-dGTP diphosphatase
MRKGPALTVDIVIRRNDGSVVLVRRRNSPFKGEWALPGGFVEYGETVEAAARREAKEETGLDVELVKIVGVYSDPNRDPRGHTVSICFLAREVGGELRADSDAKDAKSFHPSSLPPRLAFDHLRILADAGVKK